MKTPAHLAAINPYRQGHSAIAGLRQVIKLSSNELALPLSPKALAAYQAAAATINRYPDGSQQALRLAIAAVHSIPAANLFVGNGSEEAIGLIIRVVLSAGDEMVISENSFLMAEIYARAQGGKVLKCAEKEGRVDVDAMLAAVTDKTRIVYICSPNNPTATYTTQQELARLVLALPEGVLLMVDGAYAEFVDAPDYSWGKEWFTARGQVALTRTFSKAYGLAGLRVGWALVPDNIADAVARIRTPFNVNAAAMATAEAVVRDQAWLQATVKSVQQTRAHFVQALQDLGLNVLPSQTNFVLLRFPAGGQEAQLLDQHLRLAGILGRPPTAAANEYRISIGTDEEMHAVLAVLRGCIAQLVSKAAA